MAASAYTILVADDDKDVHEIFFLKPILPSVPIEKIEQLLAERRRGAPAVVTCWTPKFPAQ